jgi:hypothetical protein
VSPTWSKGAVVIVVVVLLVAGIGATVWATASRSPSPARDYIGICSGTFGGVNISYLGNQTGFLTTGYFPEFYYCYSEFLAPNSTISLALGLHNYDLNNSHVIRTFTVLPPYSLSASSPGFPITIAAGGNLSFDVTVHVPATAGSYDGPGASLTVV